MLVCNEDCLFSRHSVLPQHRWGGHQRSTDLSRHTRRRALSGCVSLSLLHTRSHTTGMSIPQRFWGYRRLIAELWHSVKIVKLIPISVFVERKKGKLEANVMKRVAAALITRFLGFLSLRTRPKTMWYIQLSDITKSDISEFYCSWCRGDVCRAATIWQMTMMWTNWSGWGLISADVRSKIPVTMMISYMPVRRRP